MTLETPLHLEPTVREALPGMRIVTVVARSLDPDRAPAAVAARWNRAWSGAGGAEPPDRPQDHPRVEPWRDAWTRLGISRKRYPTSIEALLRRALKSRSSGEEPFRVHPIVDFYNAVSLEHVVPAGAFDLDELAAPLDLRLSRPGDTFRPLGTAEAVPVAPGEIVYASGSTVLTRHLLWRQSEDAAMQPTTTRAIFVSEILPELGEEAADDVRATLVEGLTGLFGAEVRARVI